MVMSVCIYTPHHAENFLGCCLDVCVAGSDDSAGIKPVVLIGSD